MTGRRCPTPSKVAHPTEAAARKHAGGLYAREGKAALVHPYKCPCGSWHVGGRRKRQALIVVDDTTIWVLPGIQHRATEEWWALLDWCRRHGMVPEQMPVRQVIFRDVARCRVEYDEFVLVDGVRCYDAREPSGYQVRRVVAEGETPPMPFPDVILRHLDTTQETA